MGDDDWRTQPGWAERFVTEVSMSLASAEDDDLVALLGDVEELLSSGNEWVATLVAQAGLYRATHGPLLSRDFDAAEITDPSRLEAQLAEALSIASHTPLLAITLGAVGRVSSEQHLFDRAREVHLAAAEIWAGEEGSLEHEALELLRAGASAHNQGDVAGGIELARRAREAFTLADIPRGAILAILNLVQAYDDLGDIDRARALLQEARNLGSGIRDGHISASIRLDEALLNANDGNRRDAHDGFLAVYRSARRRGDRLQAMTAARNLAVVADEEQQPRRAAYWWGVAADLATGGNDWREEQDVRRVYGIALATIGRYDEAMAAFDRAIDINVEHDSKLDAARSRADKGAMLLDHATREVVSDDQFDELVGNGFEVISRARVELEELGDFEWAAITARNLRTAWIFRNMEAEGATTLANAAERFEEIDVEYARELRRNAAWLMLAAGISASDDPRPAEWLIEACVAPALGAVERSWSLAKEASTLVDRGFRDTALRLYDHALDGIVRNEDPSAYGNILNDSVLAIAPDGNLDEVRRRLGEVEEIARTTKDRVLLGLALSNLAETAVRQGDKIGAREYFARAIELAEEVGDDASAAGGLAALANTYIEEDSLDEARRLSEKSLALAVESGDDEAWSRAASSTASVAFARGDYETAFATWATCADHDPAGHAGEHEAYALDALAHTATWSKFRRELDRYARRSRRAGAQFDLVQHLYLSMLTWLRRGKPAAAGTILAYGVLLAFEAAGKAYGPKGRHHTTADRLNFFVKTGAAMGSVRTVFIELDLPESDLETIRRAYERTIRRAAGEDADGLIEIVDRFALSDEDEYSA